MFGVKVKVIHFFHLSFIVFDFVLLLNVDYTLKGTERAKTCCNFPAG